MISNENLKVLKRAAYGLPKPSVPIDQTILSELLQSFEDAVKVIGLVSRINKEAECIRDDDCPHCAIKYATDDFLKELNNET